MDETNLDTEYSRNRIRHQVLPELKQINGQAVAHINPVSYTHLDVYKRQFLYFNVNLEQSSLSFVILLL